MLLFWTWELFSTRLLNNSGDLYIYSYVYICVCLCVCAFCLNKNNNFEMLIFIFAKPDKSVTFSVFLKITWVLNDC